VLGQPVGQGSIDALANLLRKLKRLGILRAFAFGEKSSGLFLRLQKWLCFIEKLIAVFGPPRDLEADKRNHFGRCATTASSASDGLIYGLGAANQRLGYGAAFSAAIFK
jgi:hypothetical protein